MSVVPWAGRGQDEIELSCLIFPNLPPPFSQEMGLQLNLSETGVMEMDRLGLETLQS